jgi:hypothetical protein
MVNLSAESLPGEVQNVLLMRLYGIIASFHIFAGTLFTYVHEELLVLRDIEQI